MTAPEADDDWFGASNEVLVDRYLRAKLDGKLGVLARAAYFLDADVCSARPWELVAAHTKPARVQPRDAGDGKQWYFFSPARFVGSKQTKRRSRTIDGTGDKESWHAEGRPKPVEDSAAGGYMTKLSYHVRIGPHDIEKPGWIMTEYSFKDTGAGDLVLCKVYKSPRGPGRSTSSSSSAKSGCNSSTSSLSCTSSATSGRKRKAAADDLEAATPSTRPRMTHDLLSVNAHPAAPEFGEMQNVNESQPEPQIVPASFDGDIALEDFQKWSVDGAGGEDFEAFQKSLWGSLLDDFEQQDAAVQTAHGPMTDGDVIAALATGVTVDDLLLDGPSCPHPAGGVRDVPCI